jgi:NAD(P)-dependent dehydrogenase (short-subunit alcohol dehydrogenase family)
MKTIIVLGGSGFFGNLIVQRLREAGLQPLVAARSSGDLRIDANNADDLRVYLKQRDLVIDAAGPFHTRTPALIETAMRIGFDIIDLSDSPEYTAMIYERAAPISAAGIRVLAACSTLSTLSAIVVKTCGLAEPRRFTAYLRPESRYTANRGAVESFLHAIEGVAPHGMKVKSVDTVTFPRLFPTLQTIEFVVDSGATGNFFLQFAAFRRWIQRHQEMVLKSGRIFGKRKGIVRFEVSTMLRRKVLSFRGRKSYMIAVFPAVQAAMAIAAGRFPQRGLVPPTEHVDTTQLYEALRGEGITIS